MNNKMVERLLYAVMGDTELYTEHDDRELSTIFSAALKQAIPEFKTRNNLEEQVAELENSAERHGFEQGLKMGLRLMSFAMGDKNT